MTTRRIVGILLIVIGGVAGVVYAMGIIDPVGTKMADDGDPFGAAPSWQTGTIGLVVSLAVAGMGSWLTVSRRPKSRQPEGGDAE